MILSVSSEDAEQMYVDRDGVSLSRLPGNRQGFDLYIGGLTIHFEDEEDATRLALMVVERLGLQRAAGTPAPSEGRS